ncbi:MAG: S-layer protein [Candidatus Diapherotrites archaeon]
MKGLSIKRLAAVATGAAMVGAALAPLAAAMDLTKSDIYGADGSPKVNIVVGSGAMISDAVWAGNIAAKIAEKAVTDGTVSVSGEAGDSSTATVDNLKVELSIGGSKTYEGAKTYKSGETTNTNDTNSYSGATEFPKVILSHSHLPNLYYSSKTIKWAGSSYTRTMQEYINVTGDVRFNYDNDGGTSDLEMQLAGEGDFNYTISLGTGIPVYESATTTKFTDGTNDNIRIPFFGEEYLVREVDTSGTNYYVKLIKEEKITTYNEGEVITGLKGKGEYAGQEVSVKLVEIVQTGPATAAYQATFELYDAEGNKIDRRTASSSESLETLFVDPNGDYALDTIVYIEALNIGSTTAKGTAQVTLGTNMVELYDTKGYPYSSTDTSNIYDYKVDIDLGSASGGTDKNFVRTISIINSKQKWSNSASTNGPLYAPSAQALTETGKAGKHEVSFLEGSGEQGEGYAKVEFAGFEDDEALTTIALKDNLITFTGTSDEKHDIPLYLQLDKSTSSSNFSFDGKTIYYATDTNQANGKWVKLSGSSTATLNGVNWLVDTNHIETQGNDSNATINGKDMNIGGSYDFNGLVLTLKDVNVGGDNNVAWVTADMNFTMATTSVTTSSSAADVTYLEPFSSATNKTMYLSDGNNSYGTYTAKNWVGGTVWMGSQISLKGNNDVVFKYTPYSDSSTDSGYIWLLLSSATDFTPQYNKDINFLGTDVNEGVNALEGYARGLPNLPFYWRDDTKFGGGADQEYYVAWVGVDTNEDSGTAVRGYDIIAYYDTYDNKLLSLPNTQLSTYTADVNFHGREGSNTVRFLMDERSDTPGQPDKAYDDFGTKYVLSGRELTISIPENITRSVMVVKGESVVESFTGGEELTLAKGETGTTDSGTKITVSDVTYDAKCGAGSAGTCVATPSTYKTSAGVGVPIVYLDRDAPFGTNVIVGGPIVNQLAASVTGLADELTSPGQYVAKVDSATGNVVVAGYLAADTGKAAQELIDAIDALS